MKRCRGLRRICASLLLMAMAACLLVSSASASGKYKTLHRFKGGRLGPVAGVIFDQAGNLYGTTLQGGAHGYGDVFQLKPDSGGGWIETVLHNFNNDGHDGVSSYAGLIFDEKGNLYGTTYYGGTGKCSSGQYPGCGTVFQLSWKAQGGWNERVIHSFKGGADGTFPSAGLIRDSDGNFYGTTSHGGTGNCFRGDVGCGTVFELTPSRGGWKETVLYTFSGDADGEIPYGGLVRDVAGNLYGTTGLGGGSGCGYGCGTVFRLALSNGVWAKTTLYAFAGGDDGENPDGDLILDSRGNLYGVTLGGGYRFGTVFELMPSSGGWIETVLHTFSSRKNFSDGIYPFAGLIFDQAGNLYGTARFGGRPYQGVVFKLTPNSNGGWTEKVLHTFLGHPGAEPWAGLTFNAARNLYGTTAGDGSMSFGTVFEITP